MEICGECMFWVKHGVIDSMVFGRCTNPNSEYYDCSISEEDGCIEFEQK